MQVTTLIVLVAVAVPLWGPVAGVPAGAARHEATQAPVAVETRLDLGFGTSRPGGEVALPMVLEVPEGVDIGKTVSEITFPRNVVTFGKATPGVAASLVKATIEADVRPDPADANTSMLTVTVTSGAGRMSSGIVASLSFTVSQNAPGGQVVTLVHGARAFGTGSEPGIIGSVAGRNGEIEVGEGAPLTFACFFYMH